MDLLFMRTDEGKVDDAKVKSDIYEKFIKPLYKIEFVLDDRKRVVDMWRNKHNLTVFQVAEGNF